MTSRRKLDLHLPSAADGIGRQDSRRDDARRHHQRRPRRQRSRQRSRSSSSTTRPPPKRLPRRPRPSRSLAAALVGETVDDRCRRPSCAIRTSARTLTLTGSRPIPARALPQCVGGVASIVTTGAGHRGRQLHRHQHRGGVTSDKIRSRSARRRLPIPPVAVDDADDDRQWRHPTASTCWPTTRASPTPATRSTVELENRPPTSFGTVELINGILTFVAAPGRRQASSC